MIPIKIVKILLTIKHLFNNFEVISTLAELDRKVLKNVELNNFEFEGFKKYLAAIPSDQQNYVDVGASDGVNSSSTLNLIRDFKWKGTCFEVGNLTSISYVYRNFKNVNLCQIKVTPDNIVSLFSAYKIKKNFGFLNLDIDSYDYPVIEQILKSDFKPYIISMEINEKIPPPIKFYVLYDINFKASGDHFYGCSLSSASDLLKKYGYLLSHLQGNNALFLNSDFYDSNNKSVEEAYIEGYLNLPKRKDIFWYNKDMEIIQNLDKDDAVDFINLKFQDYKGKYYIE